MERPLFGAIRWDYWSQAQMATTGPSESRAGTSHGNMAKREWAHRLPQYARVVSEEPWEVDLRADTAEAVGHEIAYARQAGLDYWAYLYYPSNPDMNRCREVYLQHPRKTDVSFSLIVSRWNPSRETTAWEDNIGEIVRNVREPSYQRVCGGRPLIYLLFWGDQRRPEDIWGSTDAAHQAVDELRAALVADGQGDPYLVAMRGDVAEAAHYARRLGMDAIATYATFGGPTYEALAESNVAWWEQARRLNADLVLPVNCGWGGPRPSGRNDRQPTPEAFRAHLARAADWVETHPDAAPSRSVLMYAWNEFDEGGFLCPTRGEAEGRRKIDQLRAVIDEVGAAS